MIIVIEPASPFAKRVRLRVTELEKYMSPSMYETTPEKQQKAFADGEHMWSLIQAYLMNKDNWYDILDVYLPVLSHFEWIYDIPELCADLDPVISVQNGMRVTFEIGDYIVDFEWTSDCIAKSQEPALYLSDIKVYSSWWTEEYAASKLQSVYYTALFHLIRWISEGSTKFAYWVFVKNKKKWRKQKFERELDVARCISQLKWALKFYVETNEKLH